MISFHWISSPLASRAMKESLIVVRAWPDKNQ
nr:MAG TPA: hypothetical protein [Herelleviridae sp.]